MRDVDLALVAGETQREPLLRLPAIAALPCLADDVARNVVAQPVLDLAELLDRADVGFLVKLAQCRRPRVLAGIDAALWHLPAVRRVDMLRPIAAPPDKDPAARIEHHQADA